MRRPERLRVRHRAEPAEPRDVVGVHDLDVREVVAVVVRPVRAQRRLDRVEGLAHGAFAERVEVHLEPERVQRASRRPSSSFGVDEARSRALSVALPSASR